MKADHATMLVYLANGIQGGAVARAAARRGFRVRGLVRDGAQGRAGRQRHRARPRDPARPGLAGGGEQGRRPCRRPDPGRPRGRDGGPGPQRPLGLSDLRRDVDRAAAGERQPSRFLSGTGLRRQCAGRGPGASVGPALRDRPADTLPRQPPQTRRPSPDRRGRTLRTADRSDAAEDRLDLGGDSAPKPPSP